MSLTCVRSKLMEHIISKHLMNHLAANNIIFDKQHGFRKKRSTDTQLLAFTHDILANLSGGRQTDVIIVDFAKAFDKVPHHRLIQKQKCSVLHITRSRNAKYKQYTLHGHILQKEDIAKYLGVVINKTPSWNNHINDVTKNKCILRFPTKKSQNWPGKIKNQCLFHFS